MRPEYLECTTCGNKQEVKLLNLCDCGGPLFARYDHSKVRREDLRHRNDLWRYAPLLPVEEERIRSRGEGGTPLYPLSVFGFGGRVARLKLASLLIKDEGLNPTNTFKARGMAVAVPMAQSLGAKSLVVPTAGNAGAALALYGSVYGLPSTVFLTRDAPRDARRSVASFGATNFVVRGDIRRAGKVAQEYAEMNGAFNVATLREPYRVEGKKTILLEIWESLGGMPDWILFPTGGGTGVAGAWKALQELRDLGWYDGPWPRIGVVQAAGCAPFVKAWAHGRDSADPWPHPKTAAAGLRVPATIADRVVLRALRETRGAAVSVTDEAMILGARYLAAFEGISACLEGGAALAGLRRLYDDGTITSDDRVVVVSTGADRGGGFRTPDIPVVRNADDAMRFTSRAS